MRKVKFHSSALIQPVDGLKSEGKLFRPQEKTQRRSLTRYLFEPDEFRVLELVENQVERRPLREFGDEPIRRVARELGDALLGLRRKFRFRSSLLRLLELDDVAVAHVAVVDALREKAEVAVAAREFHFGFRETVADVAKLRLHVPM